MGRSGRMPLPNLLRILELKTQKVSSSKIASMLYTEVPTEHAVNRIDVLYSKYKNRAFQAMKENLSDHKIAYKLFLLLVKNNSNNLNLAKQIISFWRKQYNIKISQSSQ